METSQLWILVSSIITQAISIFGALFVSWRLNHNKKKYIKDQISCKKREIWDIQKQLTAIIISKDKKILKSDFVNQLAERLRQLKKEIADLNSQLRPQDKDNTKLNVTESINMLNETISKLGGKK